jgi:hypothetical protein
MEEFCLVKAQEQERVLEREQVRAVDLAQAEEQAEVKWQELALVLEKELRSALAV